MPPWRRARTSASSIPSSNNGAGQSNLGYGGFYIDGMAEAHFRGNNLTDPLGSGASRTLFNGFNTSNLSVGQHTLWVGADNFGETSESNETNNWQSITFTVTAPQANGSSLISSDASMSTASVQNVSMVEIHGAGQPCRWGTRRLRTIRPLQPMEWRRWRVRRFTSG